MIELLALPAWRDEAVCRDIAPERVSELFFPPRGSAIPPAAFELCNRCPVAAECLVWNKRSISQAFETMGLRSALNYGLEACVQLDGSGSAEYRQFDALRREKGLAEAIKWRDGQFAPFE